MRLLRMEKAAGTWEFKSSLLTINININTPKNLKNEITFESKPITGMKSRRIRRIFPEPMTGEGYDILNN